MKLYDKDPIFSHFLKIFTTTAIFFPQDMLSLFDMIKYNEIISLMSQIISIYDFVNFFYRIIWTFQELWVFIFLRESDIVNDVVCVFSTQGNPPRNIKKMKSFSGNGNEQRKSATIITQYCWSNPCENISWLFLYEHAIIVNK